MATEVSGMEPQHRKVTIVEMSNGNWCWHTELRGMCMYPTAEEALKGYLAVHPNP